MVPAAVTKTGGLAIAATGREYWTVPDVRPVAQATAETVHLAMPLGMVRLVVVEAQLQRARVPSVTAHILSDPAALSATVAPSRTVVVAVRATPETVSTGALNTV